MWFFTLTGFYSVVQKPGDQNLTVRARVAADLDRLRAAYLPSLSRTMHTPGVDYPYRASITHEDFAQALGRMAMDICHDNFKAEVAHRLGPDRALTYHQVWEVLRHLEAENRWPVPAKARSAKRRPAKQRKRARRKKP